MQTLSISNPNQQLPPMSPQFQETHQLPHFQPDKPSSHTQAQTQHDPNHISLSNQNGVIPEIQQKKQNRTQTTSPQSAKDLSKTLKPCRQQYLESIRLSYMVLGTIKPNVDKAIQKKQKQTKKSFIAVEEQNPTSTPKPLISKQSLKQPLLIDLKKIQSSNSNCKKTLSYFNQLSQQLYLFNATNKRWQRSHFQIDEKSKELIISNLHIPLLTIQKIKIFRPKKAQKMNEIKVTYSAGNQLANLFLNVKEQKLMRKLPTSYLIFQQIVSKKLANQNTNKQTKWSKQPHICEQVVFESYIFGEIYKRSQFFGKWEKRYIVLNSEGVFSYKSAVKKEDCSFFIERKSIEYLWTRFDMIDGYLVIKVKHGMKQTQFGIPVSNYGQADFKNWLFYFYKLMETGKN